jgi:hypothetical protein
MLLASKKPPSVDAIIYETLHVIHVEFMNYSLGKRRLSRKKFAPCRILDRIYNSKVQWLHLAEFFGPNLVILSLE